MTEGFDFQKGISMKPYEQKNITFAKHLRQNLTQQESKLWFRFLRDLPIKFYKQRAIGNYIVDFYSSKAKLVVEIDGIQHNKEKNAKYDFERSEYLESLGLKVMRFKNLDIDMQFDNVCEHILYEIKERTPPSLLRSDTSP